MVMEGSQSSECREWWAEKERVQRGMGCLSFNGMALVAKHGLPIHRSFFARVSSLETPRFWLPYPC